ncbi:hypothetical protein [Streptomyces sp. NPDC058989]|uniref:hypothetical protein n=1 Tax=Streptomyces sp. NPDC058989 TaxID=3346686 RepID=UPI0036A6006B
MIAGIAGFVKAVLCVGARELVPGLNHSAPGERIPLDELRLRVNTETRSWPSPEGRACRWASVGPRRPPPARSSLPGIPRCPGRASRPTTERTPSTGACATPSPRAAMSRPGRRSSTGSATCGSGHPRLTPPLMPVDEPTDRTLCGGG